MGFLVDVINHFRLTWRLFWDERVRWWQRAVFIIPLVYLLIPFRYDVFFDLMPLIGLLDDWLLFLLCTYIFVALCPRLAVREHRMSILLSDPDPKVRERARGDMEAFEASSGMSQLEMYRHPQESLSLALSLAILVGLSALGGILAGLLLISFLGLSYVTLRLYQARITARAIKVNAENFPQVQTCVERCLSFLPSVSVDVFILPSSFLGAYTFGIDRPYTVALGSRLVKELNADELEAVIGHELGHVLFEHTFLSSLMGGMLYARGLGLLWALIFVRWRRFAELTADRIALLACGDLETVIRTLVKVSLGVTDRFIDVQAILRKVYENERRETHGRWGKFTQIRPFLLTRIQALVEFDAELLALDVEKWLTR
jgi:Zn-dependent protease with chaperone function